MKFNPNKLVNKKERQIIKQQSLEKYTGMVDKDLWNFIPEVDAVFYENPKTKTISIYVPICNICGEQHIHSADYGGGHRAIHCMKEPGMRLPLGYQLKIDWSDPLNVELNKRAEKLYK